MFEVVFYEYGDGETVVSQKFNTEEQAKEWAYSLEFDYDDIIIDENGYDIWKRFYRYRNPEDNEIYVSYSINKL